MVRVAQAHPAHARARAVAPARDLLPLAFMSDGSSDESREPVQVPEHVGQKIQSISELFAKAESRVGRHQLAIERVTDAVGRPATAYILAFAIVAWLILNALAPRLGVVAYDPPPFPWLQLAASVSALLMTVTILTTQNRVATLAQQRAQLDLQVNLIAEQKIAKVIALIEELRRDLPSVKDRRDSLADAMTEAVDLDAVAGELETIQEGKTRSGLTARATPAPTAR